MKLVKKNNSNELQIEDCRSVYYSDNLRITSDKSFTEIIVPPDLTSAQEKFLMFLAMNENGVQSFEPRKCNLRDYAELVVKDSLWNVKRNLESLIDTALSLRFALKFQSDKVDCVNKKEEEYYYSVFFLDFKVTFDDNGDPIILYNLHPLIRLSLVHNGKNFAEIKFSCILEFDSVYALRLYRFMCGKVYYNSVWNFSIIQEKLAHILGVPQLKDNYQKLNQRVLKPAAEEVTEKSDIQVKYNKKRNAKVIDFECHRNEREKLDKKKKKK